MSNDHHTPPELLLANASQLDRDLSITMISRGVYPSMYPLPGSSCPPLARLDALMPASAATNFPSFAQPPPERIPIPKCLLSKAKAKSKSKSHSKKRAREDDGEDHTKAHTNTEGDGDEETGVGPAPKRRKRQVLPEGYAFMCRICQMYHEEKQLKLSREDSLKRHIKVMHSEISAVLERGDQDILKPQNTNVPEDIIPWVILCSWAQMEWSKKPKNKSIPAEKDLIKLYPEVPSIIEAVMTLVDIAKLMIDSA